MCRVPKCKTPAELVYLGLPVCDKHWHSYCETGQPDLRKASERYRNENEQVLLST